MKPQKNAYLSASLGNVLEFYDFALFGFYAKTISKLFFPTSHPLNSLLLSFGVFAIGFLCRPMGGILFGLLGDRLGRKDTLCYALVGIGFATFAMGFLPTYAVWGIASPICLTVLRIIQGISLGGEYSNSLVFVTEYLKKFQAKYPACMTGIVSAVGVVGWFAASLLSMAFQEEEWGVFSWRIPFVVGGVVALIGLYIRLGTRDAESIEREGASIKRMLQLIFSQMQSVLFVLTVGAVMGILFYGQFIFMNSFLPQVTPLNPAIVGKVVTLGLFSYMFFLPMMGWFADRVGYRRCLLLSTLLSALSAPLLFQMQFSGSVGALLFAQVWAAMMLALFFASGTYLMSLSFPFRVRCLGVSLCYNIGASLFGGVTPNLYIMMYKSTESFHLMSLFFSCCMLLGAGVIYLVLAKPTLAHTT